MITAEQRAARKNYIGSSDAPILMGVSDYKTVYDLWLDKTGHLIEEDIDGEDHIAFGNQIEAAVLKIAAERTGLDIRAVPDTVISGVLAPNLDGAIYGDDGKILGVVEIKSGRQVMDFGPDGSSEVPDGVAMQVQHQMEATGAAFALIACVHTHHGPFRLTLHTLDRCEITGAEIRERATEFWTYVDGGFPPPDTVPSARVASRIIPDGTTVGVDQSVIDDYLRAKDEADAAEERKKDAMARLRAAMGTAQIAVGSSHQVKITMVETSRLDGQALKDRYPAIAQELTKKSQYARTYVKELN